MPPGNNRRAVTLAVMALLFVAANVSAQTNERTYESLEFRVVTPGARAVAMGKTFVGIADDATAAASNPAGLSNLLEPEISLELSGAQLRNSRMVIDVPIETRTTDRTVGYPSFASVVTPLPNASVFRDVTVAAFYNSLQAYEERFNLPNGEGTRQFTEGGYRGEISLYGHAAGIAASYLVSRHVSVGGAVTWRRLNNRTESFAYSGDDPQRVRNGSQTDGHDSAFSGQLGILIKPARWWSLGAAYHPGTTFDLTTTIGGVFCPENCPDERGRDTSRPVADFISPTQPIQYRIPTRLTVGTALRPNSSWAVLGDVGLIRYSERITPKFLIVDFLGQPSAGLNRSLYYIDNAIELHTGVEYRFITRGQMWAFRGGAFTDPDHQMRFDFDGSNQGAVARGQAQRFNSYRPGTAYGVTGGGGIVLRNRFQIDAAFSWSRNAGEIVISTVMRFPR